MSKTPLPFMADVAPESGELSLAELTKFGVSAVFT